MTFVDQSIATLTFIVGMQIAVAIFVFWPNIMGRLKRK